jgi:hypothetical protein
MASIQAANTAWLAYGDSESVPGPSLYLAPFKTPSSSYPVLTAPVDRSDHTVLHAIYPAYLTSFLSAYTRYPKAFADTDSYTLFLPLSSPIADELIQVSSNDGHSHKDRKFRTEADFRLETLLRRHMVPVKILPPQIEYRTTSIEALEDRIAVDQHGSLNGDPTNRIESFLLFPHATVFFTTHEIHEIQ